ncbi:hypothetical protein I3843_11G146700 [Carya illinoinensis]|uniref:Uncharacterized protein n=1 Tax=Carya illinoinensis TaxID=32201 RepID=A0A922DR86_CARIL|nr:hypothetical protein I3760_11G146800 [Carya illinoinensis]KAG6688916.1 hypothetical protein I3842_11G149600 [Carya illinoinensis]KAG7956880.1 hypothetical protein I3843_11G146700 [Carya illinoinensis]
MKCCWDLYREIHDLFMSSYLLAGSLPLSYGIQPMNADGFGSINSSIFLFILLTCRHGAVYITETDLTARLFIFLSTILALSVAHVSKGPDHKSFGSFGNVSKSLSR